MTEVDFLAVTLRVPARPDTVFLYFTEPDRHTQWMGSRAVLDPVPGGIYRVQMHDGVKAMGEFVDVDPPHRIAFTWWTKGSAAAPGHTRVVVTFEPAGGGTQLALRHYDLPDEERALLREMWHEALRRLAVRARG